MKRNDEKLTVSEKQAILDIGLNVAFYRRKRNLSQEQLAEKAQLSYGTISHLESNIVYTVSMLTIIKIAEALEIPLYKLFKFDED